MTERELIGPFIRGTRPHCICFISAKGGAGKTVLSASLAVALAAIGEQVTIADCDAATNGLTLLFLQDVNEAKDAEQREHRFGLFDDVKGKAAPDTMPLTPSLSLVPATYSMNQTETVSQQFFSEALRNLVAKLSDSGEDDTPGYLILDAQAGTDSFALSALEFADQVVIVSEYDPISAVGVERLRIGFRDSLPRGKTWTLYNKLLPEYATELGEFLSVAAFLPPISWNADVIRAFARRELPLDMDRGNSYTFGILAVADALLRQQLHSKIADWRREREGAIREPIRDKLRELDVETDRLERSLVETSYQLKRLGQGPFNDPGLLGILTAVIALVASSAIILKSNVSHATLIANIGFALSALLVGTSIFWIALRQNKRGKLTIELEARNRALERRLREMEAERARYQALVVADTESLLSHRATSFED